VTGSDRLVADSDPRIADSEGSSGFRPPVDSDPSGDSPVPLTACVAEELPGAESPERAIARAVAASLIARALESFGADPADGAGVFQLTGEFDTEQADAGAVRGEEEEEERPPTVDAAIEGEIAASVTRAVEKPVREPPRRALGASPRRERWPAPPGASTVVKRLWEGQPVDCTEPDVLAAAVWELEDRLEANMAEWDCDVSQKAARLLDAARDHLMTALKRQTAKAREDDMHERSLATREKYDELIGTIADREKKLEATLSQQEQTLKERHEMELQAHDAKWTFEPKVRQFNRSPQKLRVLRRQQQLFMSAHQFDDAKDVRKLADRLMRTEAAEQHRQLQTEFEASRVLLEQKHVTEQSDFARTAQRRREEFRFIRDRLTMGFLNRFRNLKLEDQLSKDPEKVWALYHRNDVDPMVKLCGAPRIAPPIEKTPKVATYNTLPLPPLTVETRTRKRNRFHASEMRIA
jgi:hypothetical protein